MKTKRRVLFAWEWGAGVGHLANIASMARHIASDGNTEVVLALRDLASVRVFFRNDAYLIRQAPTLVGAVHQWVANPATFAGLAWNLGYCDADRTHSMVEAWRGLLIDTKASFVISDFGLGALLAAWSLGIPAIRFGTGFFCPPVTSPLRPMRVRNLSNMSEAFQLEAEILRFVNQAMDHFGSPKLSMLADCFPGPERTLLSTVPEFDAYERQAAEKDYLGIWDDAVGTAPSWRHCQAIKAVVYLKPSINASRVLRWLCNAGVEVVVAGGVDDIVGSKDFNHPLLHFHGGLINLPAAATECDFLVNNGNHGTTLRMLSLGTPVMALPLYIEHRLTADRIVDYGLGTCLPSGNEVLDDDLIRTTISEQSRRNVTQFSHRYRSLFDGAEARMIERLNGILN